MFQSPSNEPLIKRPGSTAQGRHANQTCQRHVPTIDDTLLHPNITETECHSVNRIDIPHQSDWHTGDKCRDIALRCFNPHTNDPDDRLAMYKSPANEPLIKRSKSMTQGRHANQTCQRHVPTIDDTLIRPNVTETDRHRQSD